MNNPIDHQTNKHHQEAGEGLHRPVSNKIVHHEKSDGQKDERCYGIAPCAVWSRKQGSGVAEFYHTQYREKRAENQAELDKFEDRLEGLGAQQQTRDDDLKQDGCGGNVVLGLARKYSEQREILSH